MLLTSTCHLAFNMTSTFKLMITLDEIRIELSQNACPDNEWSLGLLTINHTAQLSGVDIIYAFLHLTFQQPII